MEPERRAGKTTPKALLKPGSPEWHYQCTSGMQLLWSFRNDNTKSWSERLSEILGFVDGEKISLPAWEIIPVRRPYGDIQTYIEAEIGDFEEFKAFINAIALEPSIRIAWNEALVPTDKRASNGETQTRSESGTFEESTDSYQIDTNRFEERQSTIEEKRDRAVSRSPEIVQKLFHQGLIGRVEAVKLGPRLNKRPTEEQLERRDRADQVGLIVEQFVRDHPPPADPASKPAYKRQVNKLVNQELDIVKRVSVSWSEDAEPMDIAGVLVEKIDEKTLIQVIGVLTDAEGLRNNQKQLSN